MQNLKVGHSTDEAYGTGVTAFVFDKPATGIYHICGSSPASHELNPLNLSANVTFINGLLFCGGSAFGLAAASGAMQWFAERNRGWTVPNGVVPIVPAAAIYDLGIKSTHAPVAEDGYHACDAAIENNTQTGRIGAGTGASVGKVIPTASRMSGGVGYADMHLPDGVTVCVYAVVNSVGDVRDQRGNIIAGATDENGKFADCQQHLYAGLAEHRLHYGNSTLVAVFTDAKFSKAELKRIARMAVAGMARAISPVFTRYDGDIIFCMSLGEREANEVVVGAAAARAIQLAIENSVAESVILSG